MSRPERVTELLSGVDEPLALLAGLLHHSPVAFQIYRADGRSVLTNPAFRALFGSEPPPEYNILHDEIVEASGQLEVVRRAFAGETVQLPPMWYDPRDLRQVEVTEGRRVAVEATFFPLLDGAGGVGHVVIAFKDLTAERTLRVEAEQERDLLSLIIAQGGNGIIVADEHGKLRLFNQEAERQHGVPFSPVSAGEWASTYGLLDLDGKPLSLTETPLHRALHGHKVENARWQVRRPDGTAAILSGTATPLRAADGRSAGAVLITRDETQIAEAERQLRFQATVLENVQDSIIVTDVSGGIIGWNGGAERLFGFRAAEAMGKTPAFLYPDMAPEVLERDLARIGDGADFHGQWQGRHKDGHSLWVDVRTTRLLDAAGRHVGFIGVGHDITDRKQIEAERARLLEERERALEAAEAAARAKDEFLAMLGHELRNPLSPIVTALQLHRLRNSNGSTPELQVIERQVAHLTRLVDDLLDVSRITRGKVELRRGPHPVQEAIDKAVEMARPAIEQRRHRLHLDVPPGGLTVDGDGGRLAQVFSNLLTNAARYTEPGGNIRVRARREGDQILVSVADDGMGIEASVLPDIFDLFVQGRRLSDRSQGGLGIGLTLVRNLVQLHGGTVEALSAGPGQGTEVRVRLPALEEARLRTAREEAPPARRVALPRRVLVVDDNADAAEMLAEALREVGHEVRVAYSGPQALGAVGEFRPEVALLDIGLPVMDGYELAGRLRERLGDAPALIAMSGYGQAHDRRRSQESGFGDHLVKPVAIERLLQRIDELAVRPHI